MHRDWAALARGADRIRRAITSTRGLFITAPCGDSGDEAGGNVAVELLRVTS